MPNKNLQNALLTAEKTSLDYGMTITDTTGNSILIDKTVDQKGGETNANYADLSSALCGCSTVDIVIILKKQKQAFTGFKVYIDGERQHSKEPSV